MLPLTLLLLCSLCFAAVFLALTSLQKTLRPLLLGLAAVHLALAWWLSTSGALMNFDALPPRLLLFAMGTMLTGSLVVSRLPPMRAALEAMPGWWPIALQTFRLPLELVLFAMFAEGLVPRQMTFEGQNLDVLVGLTAPVMAWLVATQRAPRALLVGWNLFGVAMLLNVLRIAITSFPGPLHLDWPGAPLTAVATWPYVLIPAFCVPLAAWGHLATWRFTLARPAGLAKSSALAV